MLVTKPNFDGVFKSFNKLMTQLDQITVNSSAEIEEQKRVIAEAEAKRASAEGDVDRASRIKARLEDLLS